MEVGPDTALTSKPPTMETDCETSHVPDVLTPASWTWLPILWTWGTILQLFFSILGILGNILVMIVLFKRRRIRRSTDTLISALAFADFLASLCLMPLPQVATLPSESWLSQVYCRIVYRYVVLWIAFVASVFTLTTISLERYLAIAHPFVHKRYVNHSRTCFCVVGIWIAAIAINSYQFVTEFATGNACVVRFPSHPRQQVTGIFVFVMEFVLPVVIMALAQVMTAMILHKQSRMFQDGESRQRRPNLNHIIAKKHVIQMLFIVTIVFLICWVPDQTIYLLINTGVLDMSTLYSPIHRLFVILACVNSCANVFIYTIRHSEFRKSLKGVFCRDSKSLDK